MPTPASHRPRRTDSTNAVRRLTPLTTTALLCALISVVCLLTVLITAAFGIVVWRAFTLLPFILFPLAFILMMLELVMSGARRRRF